uniref:PA domain-containing protein n=1 Tax=Xiphophorus couchianus TaxID=32473 RepID=A0A3B5LZW7_9TELE
PLGRETGQNQNQWWRELEKIYKLLFQNINLFTATSCQINIFKLFPSLRFIPATILLFNIVKYMDIFYSAVFPACYWSILVSCPSRSLTSSLHLVDSAGRVSEQIPLNPSDYCPYSATGNYTGGVVYAHYGRPEDFNWLRSVGVSAAGHLVVMRVGGGVSFAEKVRLAERNGGGGRAAAVRPLRSRSGLRFWSESPAVGPEPDDSGSAQQHLLLPGGPRARYALTSSHRQVKPPGVNQ